MISRHFLQSRLVESLRLEGIQQTEDDPLSPEKVVRGTWSHPNPSLIYLYNPRLLWMFRVILMVIAFCAVMIQVIREILVSS